MNEKKPVKKVASGSISISFWETNNRERACVQHSRKNKDTGEWHNQQIWLNAEELNNIRDALDKLEKEGNGSPSFKVYKIIEYIKRNSLDAGLDVFDIEEMSVHDVLAAYDIHAELSPSEERIIRRELKNIIEEQEFAEMAYCAIQDSIMV